MEGIDRHIGEFLKITGAFWGVPIARTIVSGCPYWGPCDSGNYYSCRDSRVSVTQGEFQNFRACFSVRTSLSAFPATLHLDFRATLLANKKLKA